MWLCHEDVRARGGMRTRGVVTFICMRIVLLPVTARPGLEGGHPQHPSIHPSIVGGRNTVASTSGFLPIQARCCNLIPRLWTDCKVLERAMYSLVSGRRQARCSARESYGRPDHTNVIPKEGVLGKPLGRWSSVKLMFAVKVKMVSFVCPL